MRETSGYILAYNAIYIYDSRFRKNYALISHERKRRILSQILFKSPPMTLFLPFYLCKPLASLCKFHEFGTTIRNLTNILENFINRVLRIQIQPLPQRGTLHNRKKPRAEKEEEGKKETALETRCLPRSQIPKSSVFSSHRNAISSNSPSAVISTVIPLPWKKIADSSTAHKCATRGAAARRRGARAACACGEREDARVNALDAPARRAGEGGTRS